jgi:hypothetical protein
VGFNPFLDPIHFVYVPCITNTGFSLTCCIFVVVVVVGII